MADAPPADSQPFPAPPAGPPQAGRWAGFPANLTSFIGRQADIAALLGLLRQPDGRLVTLTGPGGVGKTRLALAVASVIVPEYEDGAVFVPLAHITDSTLVLPAIAHALEIRETLERPVARALVAALRDRQLLLVLDNLEHVLAAAHELGLLLAACPRLTLLVTSREPLRLAAEQRFRIEPLALPDLGARLTLDTLSGYEAIALFIARARSVRRGFSLTVENRVAVIEICRRLDGLPLAVELAAAWVRVIPPASLLAGLNERLPLLHGGAEDQPARLRTMRDAIAWSHDLLTPEEARLLHRLAVFVGGFSLSAAAHVAGDSASPPISPGEVAGWVPHSLLDLLAALVDKSLIQSVDTGADEPRYQMLETLREFAFEQLAAAGEAAEIEARHAAFMLALAERCEPHVLGPDELPWQELVDTELGNLRVALVWWLAHDPAVALRVGAALWPYWANGQLAEGRRWLAAALSAVTSATPRALARALTADAALAILEGNVLACITRSQEAVRLARQSGDSLALARAQWIAACGFLYSGQLGLALPRLTEALPLFAGAVTETDLAWRAYAQWHHALVNVLLGNPDALPAFRTGVLPAIRSAEVSTIVLGDLAGVMIAQGDLEGARSLLQQVMQRAGSGGHRWPVVQPLLSMALIDVAGGQAATAARRLGAAAALMVLASVDPPENVQERIDHAVASARASLGAASFQAHWEAGRADPAAVISEAAGNAPDVPATVRTSLAAAYGLSSREHDVLCLLIEGQTDKGIAAALFVSRRTASKHVAAILDKLGVESRTAAVATALRYEQAPPSP
ncbi:MAG: AAA family ATPase [Thermomicrobiales bacterium]|nr:AAA family ATPase [Thermomicrobiales bacterium]